MKTRKSVTLFMLFLPLLLLAGCGENTTSGATATSTLADSLTCIGCHGSAVSPVTGAAIADEWKLSRHNTASANNSSGVGAGCRDCHEPAAGHPNNCGRCHGGGTPSASNVTGLDVTANPDTMLKCSKCHHGGTLSPAHFRNSTSLTMNTSLYPASYVSSRYIGNCRKCHNPHDPTSQMAANQQWARSGHGNTTALPWTFYDFKTMGIAGTTPAQISASDNDCVRCHTTTGFINFVSSGFRDISGWGAKNLVNLGPFYNPSYFNSVDKTKQVLACDACHDDGNGNAYNWSMQRNVAAMPAYYNYSSKSTGKLVVLNARTFPDLSTSNICMPCHSGRVSGQTIKAIEAAEAASGSFNIFSSAKGIAFSSVNSHALTAGATVFRSSGYEYPGKDYSNVVYYEHDLIGVNNTGGTGTKGPCVGCHMNSTQKHTFSPVSSSTGSIVAITSQTCVKCHNGPYALTAAFLQGEKDSFNAALAALAEALKVRGFVFAGGYPYFANVNWQTNRGTTGGYGHGTGGPTLGAAFNFNLLFNEPGAYAHNSIYAKRLIYDSIDWIDDGLLNNSVAASLASGSVTIPTDANLLFGDGGTTINFDAAMKANALTYLGGSTRP